MMQSGQALYSSVVCPLQSVKIFCKHIACVVDSWTVEATMDLRFCNASVDFNVPGKPNPPPNKLTATVWRQARYLTTGILTKNAIVFTDPSGTLALPSVPLNTWVQLRKDFVYDDYFPNVDVEGCIENGLSLVFQDQRDGDRKLVTVVADMVTLTSFDGDKRFVIYCCNA